MTDNEKREHVRRVIALRDWYVAKRHNARIVNNDHLPRLLEGITWARQPQAQGDTRGSSR